MEADISVSELSLPSQDVEIPQIQDEEPKTKEYKILIELIEDLDKKKEVMLKVEAIEDILQASDEVKEERIQSWAEKLEKHPRTIKRWLAKVEKEGLAAIARAVRSDAGQFQSFKHWKNDVNYWVEFIQNCYKKAKKAGLGITPNLVYNQVCSHAELKLGLKKREYPSHMFVYKVLNPIIEKKNQKVRNPGQGPGIIIKVTDCKKKDGKSVEEDIVVIRSNQVWQIDHTPLDNLLVDANGLLAGCVWITAVIDTWSSCVMGYHIGFESPGSYQVALALRHAIWHKHYGPEYNLKEHWKACGLPEYIVTDRAKEFKSAHLTHIATDLGGIKLRLRRYTQQGGVIERLFLQLKTEFAALIIGYKGGNLQERPKNAEKKACVSFEEYEKLLVQHFLAHSTQHFYKGTSQVLIDRWLTGLPNYKPKLPDNERELDICLMKQTKRKVQEYGTIEFNGLKYTASLIKDDDGHWRFDQKANFLKPYEGKEVALRYNPSNIVYLLIYTREKNGQPSKYLGTIRARDLDKERLSLKELQDRKNQIREDCKKVDQTSILAQQRDLLAFSLDKAKTLRGRRKTEQFRITSESNHGNVVQMHPENSDKKIEESRKQEAENRRNELQEDAAPPDLKPVNSIGVLNPSSFSLQQETEDNSIPSTSLNKTISPALDSSSPKVVESKYKQNEISVKPALFVVSDWDEFMENNW
ncbi:MAG: transposase family protein [Nostoc sp. DedQUE08]|uniref:transposase family protein n=1 Tax=Nostoc sp. DedQUE08 TaxID=3075393 RepID=UPI002AD47C6C|nr:transposase family protein [Nostoc sp. DedQUE08]MDZ8069698.1 transposase family protein [Nostoc sp. DedQUE08]